MLFSKNIEKRCEVCRYSRKINDDEAICSKRGIVSLGFKCRKFSYDATKRIPSEAGLLGSDAFSEKDFSL